MKWYILYGRGGLSSLMGHPELDARWTLLFCNSETEALAISCQLFADVYVVREIGTVDRGRRTRILDAAAILGYCATKAAESLSV